MASRSNTTYQKRQKELARMEKRKDKAARRESRKQDKGNGGAGPPVEAMAPEDLGLPPEEEEVVEEETLSN